MPSRDYAEGLECRQEEAARDRLSFLATGELARPRYHRAPVFFLYFQEITGAKARRHHPGGQAPLPALPDLTAPGRASTIRRNGRGREEFVAVRRSSEARRR